MEIAGKLVNETLRSDTFEHSWMSLATVCVGYTIWEAMAEKAQWINFSFQVERNTYSWRKLSTLGCSPSVMSYYHMSAGT